MTIEEAKRHIKFILSVLYDKDGICYVVPEDREALDMAIKALEQQTDLQYENHILSCELEKLRDEIKTLEQQSMDKTIDDHYWKGFNNGIRTSEWRTSKQQLYQWRGMEDELPKESGKYICVFGGTNHIDIDYYYTQEDIERDELNIESGFNSQNVVAWMPLPKWEG